MHILHTPVDEYWRRWAAFDEAARFLELTPADRHMAWAEQTADEHFYEWPVPVEHFIQDPYYVGTDVIVRPMIGDFMRDFWTPDNNYQLFVFIAGIGSGKSFSASLSLLYTLYILGIMRNPQKYLSTWPGVSLSGDAEIVLMNASAAGSEQSSKIVYGEVFEKVQKAPFFRMNYEPYQDRIRELEFPNRVRFSPGTSHWQSALGWNLFGFVVDEAAFGIESERADYVRELFLNLNQRRRSRFGHLGWGGLFTSPGSEYGFVELIADQGKQWDTSIMVVRTTTWEAKDELKPGAKVFLLDRDPDTPRILDKDLEYLGENVCQRADGSIVRFENLPRELEEQDGQRAA